MSAETMTTSVDPYQNRKRLHDFEEHLDNVEEVDLPTESLTHKEGNHASEA